MKEMIRKRILVKQFTSFHSELSTHVNKQNISSAEIYLLFVSIISLRKEKKKKVFLMP